MPNKTIPQLPEQTGKTDDDLLVIVDSGETTTSKIKVSTLLSGAGAPGVTGDTLNDSISSVNSIVGTPNVFFGSSGYTNFGYGNEVFNDSVVYGYNNVSSSDVAAKEMCIGYNNNFKSGSGLGSEAGNITIGHGNTKQNDGIIFGKDNTGSRGLYLGWNLTSNNGNDIAGLSLVGRNITSNGVRGVAQGGNISNVGDFSISHGWFNNHNNRSGTIASGWGNTINSNGSLTTGYNVAIGLNNTITGGIGQYNLSSDSDITSTGTHNTILGGYQNSITGTTSGTTIIGLSGYTATEDDTTYVKHSKNVGQGVYNWSNSGSGSAFTLDFNEGNLHDISMSADTSIDLTNVKVGGRYSIKVFNEGTYAITGITATGFNVLWEGAAIPTITSSGTDLLVLEVFGSDILIRHFANFATAE